MVRVSDGVAAAERDTLQLCLVNNNPTSTMLMTSAGQPLYSITTPMSQPQSQDDGPSSHPPTRKHFHHHQYKSTGAVPLASRLSVPPTQPVRSHTSHTTHTTAGTSSITRSSSERAASASTPKRSLCSLRHGPRTTIRRLEDYNVTTGHVETTVGIINYGCSASCRRDSGDRARSGVEEEGRKGEDTVLELCEQNFTLSLGPPPLLSETRARLEGPGSAVTEEGQLVEDSGSDYTHEEWVIVDGEEEGHGEGEDEEGDGNAVVHETSWDFVGPDNKNYKWQLLGPSPVLTLIDTSIVIPIARFRRPKLGIVSRPRKGFLEILPSGCFNIDLIVTTFVGFMKQRVLPLEDNHYASVSASFKNSAQLLSPPRQTTSPVPLSAGSSGASLEPSSSEDPSTRPNPTPQTQPIPISSLPHRFHSAAALARKHSRSPPASAITFPPFAVKPKIRPLPTSNIVNLGGS